jgi:hypothetical protein
MHQADLLHVGQSPDTLTEAPEVTMASYERVTASRHLDAIGMGMMEAVANGDSTFSYVDTSRDWSSDAHKATLYALLRDYVNYQEGWTCTMVWIEEYNTRQDLPYNNTHPGYADPHQRIVVIAERVNLP